MNKAFVREPDDSLDARCPRCGVIVTTEARLQYSDANILVALFMKQQYLVKPFRQEVSRTDLVRTIVAGYLFFCGTIVSGTVAIQVNASADHDTHWTSFGIAVLCGAMVIIACLGVVMEFGRRAVVAWRVRRENIYLAIEASQLVLYRPNAPAFSIPPEILQKIEVRTVRDDIAGYKCGIGFILAVTDRVEWDVSRRARLQKSFGKTGAHIWFPSMAIGKREQCAEFIEWLKDAGFSDRITQKDIYVKKRFVPTKRQDILVTVILTLLAAIAVASFWW
jgi:hypothetical protein